MNRAVDAAAADTLWEALEGPDAERRQELRDFVSRERGAQGRSPRSVDNPLSSISAEFPSTAERALGPSGPGPSRPYPKER
jgi:hypothetical protein